MGIFKSLFGSENSKSDEQSKWIHLIDIQQLEDIKSKSITKPQVIFKHSTRCGISRMVLNAFEKAHDFNNNAVDFYYLDLLQYRNISNHISETFGVFHQSPQLLIIKNGVVVAHDSHGAINELQLNQFI